MIHRHITIGDTSPYLIESRFFLEKANSSEISFMSGEGYTPLVSGIEPHLQQLGDYHRFQRHQQWFLRTHRWILGEVGLGSLHWDRER